MNLYEKIQAVSQKVKNIEKDMTVGKGNYQYKAVSDIAVTMAVKDAENDVKLLSIPIKQELVSSEVIKTLSNGKESLKFIDNIKMTLRIIDLEDTKQFIDVESFGKGVDTGDKGFGKASTYARKYALLNAYKIATGEDPDANKSDTTNVATKPSDKLIQISNYLDKHLDTLQELLQYFSVGTLEDLTEKQINTIYKTYSEKGLI